MGRVVLGLSKINVYGFLNVLDYKYQVYPVSNSSPSFSYAQNAVKAQ